jgi:hypothetical protein
MSMFDLLQWIYLFIYFSVVVLSIYGNHQCVCFPTNILIGWTITKRRSANYFARNLCFEFVIKVQHKNYLHGTFISDSAIGSVRNLVCGTFSFFVKGFNTKSLFQLTKKGLVRNLYFSYSGMVWYETKKDLPVYPRKESF